MTMISTALVPFPKGVNAQGVIPILSPYVPPDDDRDDADDREDAEDTESLEVELPEDVDIDDQDPDALVALQESGLSLGEAAAYLAYMRPADEVELEALRDPMTRDLTWIDDPAHADDLLTASKKGGHAMTDQLQDASYGDSRPKQRPSRFVLARDVVKLPLMKGAYDKLAGEHAAWLVHQDGLAGVERRPPSFYRHVGKLWAVSELKKAGLPTTASAGWSRPVSAMVGAAESVLSSTRNQRLESAILGADLVGWSPWSAVKKAAKAVGRTAEKGAQLSYKYAKKGVIAPITYTYKGVKYVGKLAERMALAPLRAIVRRFTGTMIGRRANLLAKQRGLAKPGAAEKAQAVSWAKSYVRSKGGKYGAPITFLMGGSGDEMGLGTAGTAGLILLGPIGLIALLTGLVKTSSPQAPPPAPGSDEAAQEAAAAEASADDADEGSPDDGAAVDDGSSDDSTPDQ